jgi:hypothetical protein
LLSQETIDISIKYGAFAAFPTYFTVAIPRMMKPWVRQGEDASVLGKDFLGASVDGWENLSSRWLEMGRETWNNNRCYKP